MVRSDHAPSDECRGHAGTRVRPPRSHGGRRSTRHGRRARDPDGGGTAGAPLPDMVIGVIPVVAAAVGNWLSPAWPWRRLMLPFTLITMGLALVGALEITGVRAYLPGSAAAKAAGLIAACGAVA